MYGSLIERVLAKSTQCGDCLLWKGAIGGGGRYPLIHYDGQTMSVRLALWRAMGKKLARGHSIKPSCGEEKCVAVEHLVSKRYAAKKKTPKARAAVAQVMRGKSKLNETVVAEIRASDETDEEIAARLGVSTFSVKDVRTYRRWAPLTTPFAGLGAR